MGKRKKNKYNSEKEKAVGYQDFIRSAESRKKLIQSFNLMDDTFFAAVMEDREACAYLLRQITGVEDLKIITSRVQYHIRNLTTHSVTLDVLAEDACGKLYNIEVQKSDNDHHPKRIRYYQSNVDSIFLRKGKDYRELPEVYFIFISKFDPFGGGDNYYEIERRIKGRDEIVSNGVHEIYLNTEVENERSITSLLQYLNNTQAESEEFGALSDRVRFLKSEREGEKEMCDKVQRLIDGANEEKDRIIRAQKKALEKQKAEREKAESERNKAEMRANKAEAELAEFKRIHGLI